MKTPLSTERKVLAAFAIALTALALIGVLSFASVNRLSAEADRTRHTEEVIAALRGLLSTITDAETAQRGFIITANESFLQPYDDARQRIESGLGNLRNLTADNSGQQRQLDLLAPLTAERLDEIAKNIQLRRRHGFADAQAEIASGRGKLLQDHIRAIISAMEVTEQSLLKERERSAEQAVTRTRTVILFGSALAFAFLAVALHRIRRDFAGVRRAETALREANEELESRVLVRTRELDQSRETSERSEARIAGIVGSAMDAIISVDGNQRIMLFNAAAERLFGCGAEEVMGQMLDRFLPARYREQHHREIEQFGATGVTSRSTHTGGGLLGLRANGEEFPIEASISQLVVGDGKIYTVILRDITERKRADDALHFSELRYRRLFEAAQDGILILDVDTGRITDVNPFLTRLLGFSREEMAGKTVGELSPFKDLVSNQAMLQRLQTDGYVRYDDLPLETRDGSHIAVEFVSNVYQAGEKKVIQCNIRDITERKKSAQHLILLNTCIANLNEVVMITEADPVEAPGPKIVFVNEAFERITGYTSAETLGRSPRFLQGEKTDRRTLDEIQHALRHRQAIRRQVLNYRKDGSEYWMDIDIVPVFDAAGRCTHFVAIEHDTTAEKKNEEQLLWKTALLEAQLDSSLDGILVVDSQGKQVLQNRRMVELWKIPQALVEAKDEAAQVVFATSQTKNPGQFQDRVSHLYAHPEETGQDEIELVDGTLLDRYSAPVRDKTGTCYGRIWSFRDITERRKLELHYRQAQKMESIGQLAGGIAHDFNNILSAIMGHLYLIKMTAENPAINEYLDEITKATRRATELVNQILTFSRQNKPEREPVKLNHVVLEALKLLRASVPATIVMQTTLTDTPTVLANTTAIHQVIMNLGTNAWHAMRDQPGVLKVELDVLETDADFVKTRPDLHPGRYVRLSVSDTGCGMERAVLERIFDPFFTTKAVGEGTGLGLAVVHGIMKSHDGGISVYSRPGEGTIFHLYFPVLETEVVAREIEARPIPRGHGEHILFVDDEAVLAGLGKKVLERLGYIVTTKTSALEALAAVRDQPAQFDLVLTDLTMPVMDGAKLGQELLQIQPGLPIILMTGYSGAMTTAKVQELGLRELLPKPSTARALGEAVQRVLYPLAETRSGK